MKKTVLGLVLLFMSLVLFACQEESMSFDDTLGDTFNQNMFFINDLKTPSADPSVIYIEEGEEEGYFYMYGTTDALGATGVHAYRTKNFNSWQLVGPAFIPSRDSWAIRDIWAPEVIYMDGLYYMYYSGSNRFNHNRKGMGVAVSEHPAGPFVEYQGLTADNRTLTRSDQAIVLEFTAIDASPFVDASGDLYLYFAKDQVGGISSIWGVKMLDPVTPDYTTLKQLTQPSFASMAEANATLNRTGSLAWEYATSPQGYAMWNEGPFMYEKDGVYFLTYSANPFWAREYAVGYAISDSPLGDFVKPDDNRILGIDATWDHVSGPGHHSFFKAGNQLYMAYHAHIDRVFGNSLRALAIDEVFVTGEEMYVNGPTYSVQPLPASISGYENIASYATVSATNTQDDVAKLTDNKVAMHLIHEAMEFHVQGGKTRITFTFDEEVTLKAVLVYNSVNYDYAFYTVNSIGIKNASLIRNLAFNQDYINREFPDFPEMRPGGAFIADFAEVKSNQVTIDIEANHAISISEIVILGKRG